MAPGGGMRPESVASAAAADDRRSGYVWPEDAAATRKQSTISVGGALNAQRRRSVPESLRSAALAARTALRSHGMIWVRFADAATESEYRAFRLKGPMARQRLLLPLTVVLYIIAAGIYSGAVNIYPFDQTRGYEAPSVRHFSRLVHAGPAIAGIFGVLCLFLWPSSYVRHSHLILTSFLGGILVAAFVDHLGDPHPQLVFYPTLLAVDGASRTLGQLPPMYYLALVALGHLFVWIGYPIAGAARTFVDFYGACVLTGTAVPFSILAAREEDLWHRRDFIDSLRLRSELETVTVDAAHLREMNKALSTELQSLQRARRGAAMDLDSPFAKAIAMLKGLRNDSEAKGLDAGLLQTLEQAVESLETSGSLMVPDFNRQLREGKLALDQDTKAWLLTEVAPSQQHAGGSASLPGSKRPSGVLGGHGNDTRRKRSEAASMPAGTPEHAVAAAASLGPELALVDQVRSEARDLREKLEAWEGLEIFKLSETTHGHPLLAVSLAAVEALGITYALPIDLDRFASFVSFVEAGYKDHPYHNRIHAADVVHSMTFLLQQPGLFAELSDLDRLAAVVACLVHDYEHPAVNNNFLINTGAELATLYNDKSPLESHHIAASWRALRTPQRDFLQGLPAADIKELRKTVIEMVLATDMAQHFEVLGAFKKRTAAGGYGPTEGGTKEGAAGAETDGLSSPGRDVPPPISREDARLLLQIAMKSCDIGHAAKPLPLHLSWSHRINAEFFAQGDRERELGLPVSPFMDRTGDTPERLPKSQIGFCDFVVMPLLSALAAVVPATGDSFVRGLRDNYSHWQAELAKAVLSPTDRPPGERVRTPDR